MTEIQKLRERIRPHLERRGSRAELAKACGIKDRQQAYAWFPRAANQPATGGMTAVAALAALRWLEERPRKKKWRYVPNWEDLRLMGSYLVRVPNVARYIAQNIGDNRSVDQIPSYFKYKRRRPDGEFTLRFLKFVRRLRKIDKLRIPGLSPSDFKKDDLNTAGTVLNLLEVGRKKRETESKRCVVH